MSVRCRSTCAATTVLTPRAATGVTAHLDTNLKAISRRVKLKVSRFHFSLTYSVKYHAGIGHIELFKVTSYNFHSQKHA